MLLILTVGTGTAGQNSNLVHGLQVTIEWLSPRKCWLVPSRSEDSWVTAQLVMDEVSKNAPQIEWVERPEHRIALPDNLFHCRDVIRRVIAEAQGELREGEELIINPVSGTKQMSAGATLAALDREVGTISFTVGRRQDGVVVSGYEEIVSFDTRQFFLERTLGEAQRLYRSGAVTGAIELLQPWRAELMAELQLLQCLDAWQHQDYRHARNLAAQTPGERWRALRRHLDQLSTGPVYSALKLADLVAASERAWQWGRWHECMVKYYQLVEINARLQLSEVYRLGPVFPLNDLLAQPISYELKGRFRTMERGGQVRLTMHLLHDLLYELDDPVGEAYMENRDLIALLDERNAAVHTVTGVNQQGAARLREAVRAHLNTVRPGLLAQERDAMQLWPAAFRTQVGEECLP